MKPIDLIKRERDTALAELAKARAELDAIAALFTRVNKFPDLRTCIEFTLADLRWEIAWRTLDANRISGAAEARGGSPESATDQPSCPSPAAPLFNGHQNTQTKGPAC